MSQTAAWIVARWCTDAKSSDSAGDGAAASSGPIGGGVAWSVPVSPWATSTNAPAWSPDVNWDSAKVIAALRTCFNAAITLVAARLVTLASSLCRLSGSASVAWCRCVTCGRSVACRCTPHRMDTRFAIRRRWHRVSWCKLQRFERAVI